MGKAVTRGNYKPSEGVFFIQWSRGHIRRLNRLGGGITRRLCCDMGGRATAARLVAGTAVPGSLRLRSRPFDSPTVKIYLAQSVVQSIGILGKYPVANCRI